MKNFLTTILFAVIAFASANAQDNVEPLRIGVAGVSHGHLAQVKNRLAAGRTDFSVVGVYEDNDEYRADNELVPYLDQAVFYKDLCTMLDETKPEAVVAYGSAYDHLKVVKACAPRHIHVMVEKPLAANMRQARKIEKLARKYGIMVLTNYETTWYATNTQTQRYVDEGKVGDIFRISVYDGHRGPVEISCAPRFLEWLTDPVLNGGGAVIDFGCYGANLATWLLKGQKPETVFAVLQQNKPEVYPKVDDDATIMVSYPGVTLQINASWCWPYNRKDMYVYGDKGVVYQKNDRLMDLRLGEELQPDIVADPLQDPYDDCFRYLAALVRGEITLEPYDQASLENNMTVMQILTAAVRSGKTGRPVRVR